MKRLFVLTLAAFGFFFASASPALAHNSLVEAIPAKDATLAEPPAEVKLRFLASLKPDTKLEVLGPDGSTAIGGVLVDGKFISAPFTATAGGKYTVTYELVADDGHPTKSSYTFTLQGKTSPVVVVSAVSPEPVAQPQATTTSTTPWWYWIGGSAVAGLLLGGLITFLRNRSKRS